MAKVKKSSKGMKDLSNVYHIVNAAAALHLGLSALGFNILMTGFAQNYLAEGFVKLLFVLVGVSGIVGIVNYCKGRC